MDLPLHASRFVHSDEHLFSFTQRKHDKISMEIEEASDTLSSKTLIYLALSTYFQISQFLTFTAFYVPKVTRNVHVLFVSSYTLIKQLFVVIDDGKKSNDLIAEQISPIQVLLIVHVYEVDHYSYYDKIEA